MQINRKHKQCQHTQDGEAGFTLIEMIIVIVLTSILGIFIFQVLTKSLGSQIDMQTRKERDDAAIMVLEKIGREVKEAKTINSTGSNILIFEKNVTSSTDTNTWVRYVRNTATNRLRRQSATTFGDLPGNSTSGNILAENVIEFSVDAQTHYGSSVGVEMITIDVELADGSDWMTRIYPRNYGL